MFALNASVVQEFVQKPNEFNYRSFSGVLHRKILGILEQTLDP